MADARHLPPARTLRTAASFIWERRGRWVVRPSLPHMLAFPLGVMVGAAGVWLYWDTGDVMPALIPVVVGLLFAVVSRNRPRATFDWRARTVVTGRRVIPLARIRGLGLENSLHVHHGSALPQTRQVWTVRLAEGDDFTGPCIAQGGDLTMLRVARRLAEALGVPVYDACGPPDTLTAWHPVHGFAALPGRRPRSPAPKSTPPPPRPADAYVSQTSEGVELSWQSDRFLHVLGVWLFGGASVLATSVLLIADGRRAPVMAALALIVMLPMLLLCLPGAVEHGRNSLRITGESVILTRPFPVARGHRIPRSAVREVRLSVRLFATSVAADQVGVSKVWIQLLDDRKLLGRVAVALDQALWLALAADEALGLGMRRDTPSATFPS